jgi:hypothetical protein
VLIRLPAVAPAEEEAEEPRYRGPIRFLAIIGTLGFAIAAIYPFRAALGLPGQIAVALALAAGSSLLAPLFRKPLPRTWLSRIDGLAANLIFAAYILSILHTAEGPPRWSSVSGWAAVAACAVVLVRSIYSLITRWHDEDALTEDFGGPQPGYRAVRTSLSSRQHATLMVALMAMVVILGIGVALAFPVQP